MAGNGFPRVSRHGHRGSQVGNGRKWLKMVENGFPRLFGRKWISAFFTSIPYYCLRMTLAKMIENDSQVVSRFLHQFPTSLTTLPLSFFHHPFY